MHDLVRRTRDLRLGDKTESCTCFPVWISARGSRKDLKQWAVSDARLIAPRSAQLPGTLWTTDKAMRGHVVLTELAKGPGQELVELVIFRSELVGIFDGNNITPAFNTEAAARASLNT
jgi:hypothetical protein